MKHDASIVSRREGPPGSFGKQIAPFVILSCLLHLALVVSTTSRTLHLIPERRERREPILVDFMEHREGRSSEPGSLSPTPTPPAAAAPAPRAEAPPTKAPPRRKVARKAGKAVPVPHHEAKRKGTPTRRQREAVQPAPKKKTVVEITPRPLPSAGELLPSIRDLMALRDREARLYRAPFEQEGAGKNAARVQYNAYLSVLKRRVKDRWNVSSLSGLRDATTVVWLIIGNDGLLRSLKLAKSSGDLLLDQTAMAAIKNSFPMTAPPKNLLDENGLLHVQFSFRYMVYSPYSRNP